MAKHSKAKSPLHTPGKLTVAVVTDLHAYDAATNGKKPSHFCITEPEDNIGQHPIGSLLALTRKENIKADLLLCLGDITDKARPSPLKEGWAAVHRLANSLQARLTAGTAGNHDVDSRFAYNDHDAKGHLQSLDPPFPLATQNHNDAYWARHFVVLMGDCYRLVVLNSSAYHGYSTPEGEEYERGRISTLTLAALKKALTDAEPKPVNILMCHHHPHLHAELNLGAKDVMVDGDALLRLLGDSEVGRWFVVHGHKHHPKITYAQGTASAPIVFAAGSLCAELFLELQTATRNQFYIVEFPYGQFGVVGFGGTFRAWDWHVGVGWIKAGSQMGLPATGGFGHRPDLGLFANQIATTVVTDKTLKWEEFLSACPLYRFLLPADADAIQRLLSQRRIKVLFDADGTPCEIGKQT